MMNTVLQCRESLSIITMKSNNIWKKRKYLYLNFELNYWLWVLWNLSSIYSLFSDHWMPSRCPKLDHQLLKISTSMKLLCFSVRRTFPQFLRKLYFFIVGFFGRIWWTLFKCWESLLIVKWSKTITDKKRPKIIFVDLPVS